MTRTTNGTRGPAAADDSAADTGAHPDQVYEAIRALARASRLLERASDELTLAHYRVLSAVASGDQRASRVADRLALGKPTVSATVEALARRGLLLRSDVDGDQRAAALQVTPAGRSLLRRAEDAMAERIEAVCRHTPHAAQLLQSLVWMGAGIDEMVAERHTGRSR